MKINIELNVKESNSWWHRLWLWISEGITGYRRYY